MSTELFFIYDSHCPWSYATTPLIKVISDAFPQIKLHLMHSGYYDGENKVSSDIIKQVNDLSDVKISEEYRNVLSDYKDSTMAANLLAWTQNKAPEKTIPLLEELQKAHFLEGNPLTESSDVSAIISELKLSPPAKCLKSSAFTKEAEYTLHDIEEIRQIIGTDAIPALLLAQGDNLILLNHHLYIEHPNRIVEAVKQELN